MMQITVVGLGYVGLANALLWAMQHRVVSYDTNREIRKNLLWNRCPVDDPTLRGAFHEMWRNGGRIDPASSMPDALASAKVVVVAVPTNLADNGTSLDVSNVRDTLDIIRKFAPNAIIILRSTVPVGFTENYCTEHNITNIAYVPEFLREGSAWHDAIHPERLVIGAIDDKIGEFVAKLYRDSIPTLRLNRIGIHQTSPSEAESVKMFSNAYLAMRVAFFNQLDSFAHMHQMNTRNIIDAVCADSRIGSQYNNPSFGFGGTCLPKDIRQLASSMNTLLHEEDKEGNLFQAVLTANSIRVREIVNLVNQVCDYKPTVIGVYGVTSSSNSRSARGSITLDVLEEMCNTLPEGTVFKVYAANCDAIGPLSLELNVHLCTYEELVEQCTVIVANRVTAGQREHLTAHGAKLVTRDVFGVN